MRRGRTSADWVYRGFLFELEDPTQQEPFLSGTYYNPMSLVSGQAGAAALVLVDSHNYAQSRFGQASDGAGTPLQYKIAAPAFPDEQGVGPLIHAVDFNCHLYQSTASWYGASRLHIGFRIIVAKQDQETGAAMMHPQYSMWTNNIGNQSGDPSYFANGRQNCWEMRRSYTPRTVATNANPLATWMKAFVRFKRRLAIDEGLFLWVEAHDDTTPSTIDLLNPWCRTLISR